MYERSKEAQFAAMPGQHTERTGAMRDNTKTPAPVEDCVYTLSQNAVALRAMLDVLRDRLAPISAPAKPTENKVPPSVVHGASPHVGQLTQIAKELREAQEIVVGILERLEV